MVKVCSMSLVPCMGANMGAYRSLVVVCRLGEWRPEVVVVMSWVPLLWR
jgi:hypothetical protein